MATEGLDRRELDVAKEEERILILNEIWRPWPKTRRRVQGKSVNAA